MTELSRNQVREKNYPTISTFRNSINVAFWCKNVRLEFLVFKRQGFEIELVFGCTLSGSEDDPTMEDETSVITRLYISENQFNCMRVQLTISR